VVDALDARRRGWPVVSYWNEYRNPRLFDGTGLGLFLRRPPPPIERAYERLAAVLARYGALCGGRGVELIVVVFPQRYQLSPDDWRATREAFGLDESAFDLAAAGRRILAECRRLDLVCIDPTPELARAAGRDLYLARGDMHWNAAGHRALADAVYPEVAEAERSIRPSLPAP